LAVLSLYLFVNKIIESSGRRDPGPGSNKTRSTVVRVSVTQTVITNSNWDSVGSNLVVNLGGSDVDRLDDWSMGNSSNSGEGWSSERSSKRSGVGEDSTVQEDLGVSLSLLPLGNHGLLRSSGWGSEHGESSVGKTAVCDMSGEGVGGVSSIGQGVGGVCDGGEGGRVVDERSGGGHHTAGSSKDGGLGISGPLAVVTITIAIGGSIITSVTPVSVSVITVVSISFGLGISGPLAVVTHVWVSVVADSDSDGVSGHLMLNLGGSDDIGLKGKFTSVFSVVQKGRGEVV